MSIQRMVYGGTSYFGDGARFELISEIKKRRYEKPFLVTDEPLIACGISEQIETVLRDAGIEYVRFSGVKQNPTIENVQAGVGDYLSSGCDFIVAVGGGSVIDTAKAIAVVAANMDHIDVASLEGVDKNEFPPVPILAVPTTAGTGSETTMDYVITNVQEKRKMACMCSLGVPKAAFLDTELMVSMPIRMTIATAMDALTHAVESYLAKNAFEFSEMLSLEAVRLISDNLLTVIKSPEDLGVRKNLAMAQYMAGMSFTNVGLGIVHSLAHPLSAFYDIPHGVANAVILPYVLEFNAPVCLDRINRLAKAFDENYDGDDVYEALEICTDRIRSFLKEVGLSMTLQQLGVVYEDIEMLAQSAYDDVSTLDNPREVTVEDMIVIYKSMY